MRNSQARRQLVVAPQSDQTKLLLRDLWPVYLIQAPRLKRLKTRRLNRVSLGWYRALYLLKNLRIPLDFQAGCLCFWIGVQAPSPLRGEGWSEGGNILHPHPNPPPQGGGDERIASLTGPRLCACCFPVLALSSPAMSTYIVTLDTHCFCQPFVIPLKNGISFSQAPDPGFRRDDREGSGMTGECSEMTGECSGMTGV